MTIEKNLKKIIISVIFSILCILSINNISNAATQGFESFDNSPRMVISPDKEKYADVTIRFTDYSGLDDANIKFYSVNVDSSGKKTKTEITTNSKFIKSKEISKKLGDKSVQYTYVISNEYLNKKTKQFYVSVTDNNGRYFHSYFRIKSNENRYKVDYAPRIKGWSVQGTNITFYARDLAGTALVTLSDINDRDSDNKAKEKLRLTGLEKGDAKITFDLEEKGFKKDENGRYFIKIYAIDNASNHMSASRTIKFLLEEVDVSSVKIDNKNIEIGVGDTASLGAKVEPEYATKNTTITYTSSDETIASVDKNGKVTGKKEGGPVTITATTQNGKTATCEVKVVKVTADISLDRTVLMIDDYHYNYADLKASVIQSNGKDITENYKIKWSSSNAQVAKVSNKGSGNGRVKGLSYGTSKITASVTINGVTKTATCKLKVIAPVTEKIDNYSRIVDEDHPITNIRYRGSWSDTYGKTWYLVSGSWGNSYVESYVNNVAKLVKDSLKDDSLPDRFRKEAAQKTIWCYKQNDLNMGYDTNNNKITSVSGTTYGMIFCPMYSSNFTETSKTKVKGELSPNNYLVLFTSKNQWMYLLKKNSKTNEWNVITAKKSSGGYCINEFEDYMCIEYLHKELGVAFTYRYYSRGATTWQNSVHYDIAGMTGVPTSGGCLHAGTYSSEMYYRICHDAGVGTRLILF